MSKGTKSSSEVPAENRTSEVSKNVSTSTSEVATIPLDEYLKVAKVNPGTVASLRIEAGSKPALLEPKTEDDWKVAFALQAATVYE